MHGISDDGPMDSISGEYTDDDVLDSESQNEPLVIEDTKNYKLGDNQR